MRNFEILTDIYGEIQRTPECLALHGSEMFHKMKRIDSGPSCPSASQRPRSVVNVIKELASPAGSNGL